MKIRPVGAELFHAGEQTDRHDLSLFAILRRRLQRDETERKTGALFQAGIKNFIVITVYDLFFDSPAHEINKRPCPFPGNKAAEV